MFVYVQIGDGVVIVHGTSTLVPYKRRMIVTAVDTGVKKKKKEKEEKEKEERERERERAISSCRWWP